MNPGLPAQPTGYGDRSALPARAWLLRHAILPAGDLLFGQRMMRRLRFLEEAQWWEPERLHAHRDQLLRSLVHTAYKEVPFYRDLMDSAGVRPADIRSAGDLPRLPVVTKAMLRAGFPHRTTRRTGQRAHDVYTSGSTGTPFAMREDAETAGWYRASFLLALEWVGWQFGEPHLQTGINPGRDIARRLKDWLLRTYYVPAFDLSDARLDASLDLLERHGIQHLWGYPAGLYVLAQRAREQSWNRPLRSVVTWGDNLFPHYRRAIEQVFQARVYDTYGCSEGMQVAAQCGHGSTYHIHMLDVVVEYLDDGGQPVPAGQPGNLVVTRLHPGPMPLIRYAVGDVGIAGAGQRCDCGRGYDVMESIQGRNTDVVLTPSGNRLIVHYFTSIMEYFLEVAAFQVVQPAREMMILRIVPAQGFSPAVADRIITTLKEKGAADMAIEIELVDAIPLTPGGKRRFIVSEIGEPQGERDR